MVNNIPIDWEIKPFKEISTMSGRIGWQGLKQQEFTEKSDDPFLITGMNFKDGVIRWEEVYHLPIKRYDEAKNIQLLKDDILMTKDGTIGKLLYIDNIPYPYKASLNSHLLVFRPINNAYNPKFLFYQLHDKPFLNHIELTKSGTTFFGITQESVGKYNVYLPPKQEQKAIAQALSDIDALITSLKKLIAKKEHIKTATMQQLLTGRKRLDGFSGEWKERSILSIVDNIIDYRGVTPKKKGMEWGNGNIVALSAGNVKKGYIDFDTECYYGSEELYKKWMTNGNTKKDDIVFTMEAPLGNIALIPDNKKYILSQRIILLQVRDDIYSPYIYQLFLSQKFQNYLYNVSTGSTAKGIKRKIFEKLFITIPFKSEQKAIAQILSDMDKEIETLKTKLKKTQNIKIGMMQELLTGKTRLK